MHGACRERGPQRERGNCAHADVTRGELKRNERAGRCGRRERGDGRRVAAGASAVRVDGGHVRDGACVRRRGRHLDAELDANAVRGSVAVSGRERRARHGLRRRRGDGEPAIVPKAVTDDELPRDRSRRVDAREVGQVRACGSRHGHEPRTRCDGRASEARRRRRHRAREARGVGERVHHARGLHCAADLEERIRREHARERAV